MENNKVIIACDFSSSEEILKFLSKFGNKKLFLKIGMEMFYSEGINLIEKLQNIGHEIFLDLKICDIPNTVYRTVRKLSALGIKMLTIHAFGGSNMMSSAVEAANKKILILAVTILTSISESMLKQEVIFQENLSENTHILPKIVMRYSENAQKNKVDGVVCSAFEAKKIKQNFGNSLLIVTPGIRNQNDESYDQNRTATPEQAKNLGSDYIVVGRPITRSENPVNEYEKITDEFKRSAKNTYKTTIRA
jgi:orotidine-5'-phosphate decarboxylase